MERNWDVIFDDSIWGMDESGGIEVHGDNKMKIKRLEGASSSILH